MTIQELKAENKHLKVKVHSLTDTAKANERLMQVATTAVLDICGSREKADEVLDNTAKKLGFSKVTMP